MQTVTHESAAWRTTPESRSTRLRARATEQLAAAIPELLDAAAEPGLDPSTVEKVIDRADRIRDETGLRTGA